MIPASFCRNLLKIVEKIGIGGIGISVGETFINATFPNGVVLVSKLIDTQTFEIRDFEKVIKGHVDVNSEKVQLPESFTTCLKRIMMIYNKIDEKKMDVTITKSKVGSDVTLYCQTALGEVKETFSIRKKLEERKFAINPELLLKGYKKEFSLSFCESCLVLEQDLYLQLVCYTAGE